MTVELPLAGRNVTVVGSTSRATTTVAELLAAGAVVTAVAESPSAYVADLATRGLITLHRRVHTGTDLRFAVLVYALTGDAAKDRRIAAESSRYGVLCAEHATAQVSTAGSHEGRVILVGGGPGDPGLLTVAGQAAIQSADVVVTDRLAPVSVLPRLAPAAEIVDVSKIPGGNRTEQADINEMLVTHARAGKTVVRLKGGDGFVFGRGGEEVDFCVQAGVRVDVIPGVSSAIAAPATALIPVTHRGLTQGFTVVSGHVPPAHPDSTIDYVALAQANTTLVLMMAVANLDAIAAALVDAGMDPATPAAVIADGSLTSQREIRATLRDIGDASRKAGIGPPATTVIGAVAGFVPGRKLHAAQMMKA